MGRNKSAFMAVVCLLGAVGACGGKASDTGEATGNASCQNGSCPDGIGDACAPADEASTDFSGFGAAEVWVEDRFAGCRTGICIAAHFQGRPSCPYGGSDCTTESGAVVSVPVKPQLVARPPSDTLFCSCHCDGPEGTGPFCACPSGFECAPLVPPGVPLVGSYCIKQGTRVTDPQALADGPTCDAVLHNCDDR
jgi:hypothetical protein